MDKLYIQSMMQKILNKEFSAVPRRKINVYTDRLNVCCPFCGDGKSDYKKRGNLYFNRLIFICFNCDKKASFDRMCKEFNETIDPDQKLQMIEHLNSVVTYDDYQDNFIDAKFDKLINMVELEVLFNSNNTPISDFRPIQVNGGVYKYLVGRGISPELHKNIYQGKYWKNEDESEWIIIMLNRKGDKVLGAQVRNLKEGKRRLFKIYNYENLYKWLHGEEAEIDLSEMVIYNKLSYYFNILNVNFDNKITVFEGYIDSLFYPNSIGLVGVNTDFRFLESNNLDLQYFFDNDEAGYKKSEEKMEEGYSVFLWQKLFKDIVDKKKSDDPFKLEHRISKVKDLNKLSQLANNPYVKFGLDLFFSKDVMDVKWIPKLKKKKKPQTDYNKKFNDFDRG